MADGRVGGNHTVWGLKRKRAEIAGIVADHERKLKHWRVALANVDAVLRLMDAEIDPNSIPGKRVHRRTKYLPGSELTRYALEQIRLADGTPISCKAIVEAAMAAHDVPDNLQVRLSMMARLGRWLNDQAADGALERHGPTHKVLWTLPHPAGDDPPQ
jgi:hypothetical protein